MGTLRPIVSRVPRRHRAIVVAWKTVRLVAVGLICALAIIGAITISWISHRSGSGAKAVPLDGRALAEAEMLAHAHGDWVGDHGPGCARSVDHLLDYTTLSHPVDPWGRRYELTCERPTKTEIRVRVVSLGADGMRDADDIEGRTVLRVD
jgi:hypothetical protein